MACVELFAPGGLVKRETAMPKKERRKSARDNTLRIGFIVYGRDRRLMRCALLNISEGGAKLGPADIRKCPDRFFLHIASQPPRDCLVLWREQIHLGVKFV